tara:strand:+ start:77680 stop:78309 length:630 start_codon:yes stop_codon:yes gene_type:complete
MNQKTYWVEAFPEDEAPIQIALVPGEEPLSLVIEQELDPYENVLAVEKPQRRSSFLTNSIALGAAIWGSATAALNVPDLYDFFASPSGATPHPETVAYALAGSFAAITGTLSVLKAETKALFTRYLVTDKMVMEEKGILRKELTCVPHSRILGTQVSRGLSDFVFGTGSIYVNGAESNYRALSLDSVKDPNYLNNIILQHVSETKQKLE